MTQAVKLAQLGSPGISTGFKNRIINGAMMIDQRNAGVSISLSGSTKFPLDRFSAYYTNTGGAATAQQSSTAPTGFTNSLLYSVTTGASINNGDYSCIRQGVEGLNVADLGWGASGAATVTLSFWVRSSLTGTFSGSIQNSGAARSYVFTYTINAANTWEQKSITITGDTSGTWLKTNGIGMQLYWNMGFEAPSTTSTTNTWLSGSYNGVTGGVTPSTTTGATFYITGVQLEVGTTATDFEYRDYGRELMMCQRYLPVHKGNGSGTSYSGFGLGASTVRIYADLSFQVQPRVPPTGITTSAASSFSGDDGQTAVNSTSVTFSTANLQYGLVRLDFASGITTYRPYYLALTSSAYILWTGCEL